LLIGTDLRRLIFIAGASSAHSPEPISKPNASWVRKPRSLSCVRRSQAISRSGRCAAAFAWRNVGAEVHSLIWRRWRSPARVQVDAGPDPLRPAQASRSLPAPLRAADAQCGKALCHPSEGFAAGGRLPIPCPASVVFPEEGVPVVNYGCRRVLRPTRCAGAPTPGAAAPHDNLELEAVDGNSFAQPSRHARRADGSGRRDPADVRGLTLLTKSLRFALRSAGTRRSRSITSAAPPALPSVGRTFPPRARRSDNAGGSPGRHSRRRSTNCDRRKEARARSVFTVGLLFGGSNSWDAGRIKDTGCPERSASTAVPAGSRTSPRSQLRSWR